MGFKADESFLRFLTIGAAGVRRTMEHLAVRGFSPIELERYCASNKIWATKVKRLRLPDLLCVRTGLRFEVRAKSKLEIKMSDAPANPDRSWDSGLRDHDVVAFIASLRRDGESMPADSAVYFSVRSLRDSIGMSKLGARKSASEGAEQDRNWPASVPKKDGQVLEVDSGKIVAMLDAGPGYAKRRQTYQLKGKTSYVRPGDRFRGLIDVIAGAPAGMADLDVHLDQHYQPLVEIRSKNDVDRYAAVKALRHREDNRDRALAVLDEVIAREPDERVRLEAAGSAVWFGAALGQDTIGRYVWDDDVRADLRMEAVLVLTEMVGDTFSRSVLEDVAETSKFKGSEVRQAAIWGLGKSGMKAYSKLLPYIDDREDNVALHAMGAFGADTPRAVIDSLVADLIAGSPRRAPAASEVLRIINNEHVYATLIEAARNRHCDWILATLGRLSADRLRQKLAGDWLLERLAPMLLLSERGNWLATDSVRADITFLLRQDL